MRVRRRACLRLHLLRRNLNYRPEDSIPVAVFGDVLWGRALLGGRIGLLVFASRFWCWGCHVLDGGGEIERIQYSVWFSICLYKSSNEATYCTGFCSIVAWSEFLVAFRWQHSSFQSCQNSREVDCSGICATFYRIYSCHCDRILFYCWVYSSWQRILLLWEVHALRWRHVGRIKEAANRAWNFIWPHQFVLKI